MVWHTAKKLDVGGQLAGHKMSQNYEYIQRKPQEKPQGKPHQNHGSNTLKEPV